MAEAEEELEEMADEMMNPQTCSIPPNRHRSNWGRSNRDPLQQHHPMPVQFQHRPRIPQGIYPQPATFTPVMPGQQHNQHRVLLGNNPQRMQFPVGMGSGPSHGTGMIRAVQGQHLYQQQQLVHQRFPFSGYVPTGQGTHQPINLMQHPSGLIPQQMGIQTQPQPQQPAVIGMRPVTNPIPKHHMHKIQPAIPSPQKKKSRPILIIDPDTNVEVDLHSTGSSALTDRTNVGEQSGFNVVAAEFKHILTAVSSSTYQPPVNTEPVSGIMSFSQFTPNAIITAPKETIKPKGPFPPVLDDLSEQVLGEAMGGAESLGENYDIVLKPVTGIEVADTTQMGGAERKKRKRSDKANVGDCVAELFSSISPEPTQRSIRRIYEREFLLSLKNSPLCEEPPPGLKKFSMFVHVSRGPKDKKKVIKPVKEVKTTLVPVKKKVFRAMKPWKPHFWQEEETISVEEVQTMEVYHKFQGILNKLTLEKFQVLAEQALELEINTEERLTKCVEMIFSSTMADSRFPIVYAKLCKVMGPIKVKYVSEEGKTKHTNFRRMLLAKSQKEFEKDKKDDESMETMQKEIQMAGMQDERRNALKDEMEILITKRRKQSLCNIQFMGELFKLQMLSQAIIHESISRLIKSVSDEESLECCARLLSVTGKDLDKEAARTRVDSYFKHLNTILRKGKVSSRIRFLLLDVIELRKKKWVPRVRQDQQLKTIYQIHAEAAMKEEEEKEMLQYHDAMKSGARGMYSRQGKGDHTPKDSEHYREKERFDLNKESCAAVRDLPQDILDTLHTLLTSTNISNEDINKWIKKNCVDLGYDPTLLVTNLTSAVVRASVTESGYRVVFHEELFERRMDVVKAQDNFGVAVLRGLQCSVAKLTNPPSEYFNFSSASSSIIRSSALITSSSKLLHALFNVIYDLELVDENEFYTWRDDDQVMFGKGAAVVSVKPFFDWLKSDSKSADQTY